MNRFTSETDDESTPSNGLRKSIRKRKIRLTVELNNDNLTDSVAKTCVKKTIKKKISNSSLPPIDNITLVPKLVKENEKIHHTQDKRRLKKFETHKAKLEHSVNKRSKRQNNTNTKSKIDAANPDYSDFLRKSTVILIKLTNTQIDDALRKREDILNTNNGNGNENEIENQSEISKGGSKSEDSNGSNLLNVTFDIIEEETKICKPILHKNASRSLNPNNHRVTFNNTSIVIDNINTTIPTRFPSDDESEAVTPRIISHSLRKTNSTIKTPTSSFKNAHTSKKIISPNYNKFKAGLTPAKLKSSEKKILKKGVMPDFAKMHKNMYDKMLNIKDYKEQKEVRAKLLLSGHKPDSSSKKLNSHTNLPVKKEVHKKLRFSHLKTSQEALNNSKGLNKNKSTTRRREQEVSVKNKNHSIRNSTENIRTEIKGIRTNRRFELLMKFRKTQ